MKRIGAGAASLLLASTTLAQAGALDRSGQPVGIIFQDGNYAELSYGLTEPSVSGTNSLTGAVTSSGDVGVEYGQVALSFKYDVNDRISIAAVIDQPYGADVDYGDADPTYPTVGSTAEFQSTGVTVLGRYKFNDRFSVHGGARYVAIDADLNVQSGGYIYQAEFEEESDVGYVVGAAYERPDIALRVALTYASETSYSHETTFAGTFVGSGLTEYTMPQSVTLDFQSGVAAGTLLFGSIRWADWSETDIVTPGYLANPVVDYEEDITTYTLGVGRRFSDAIAASLSVIYETETGGEVSNLSPTDGQLGIQLGGTYTLASGLVVSGGVRYTALGDATTRTIFSEFEDNDAVSLGLRVGYRF